MLHSDNNAMMSLKTLILGVAYSTLPRFEINNREDVIKYLDTDKDIEKLMNGIAKNDVPLLDKLVMLKSDDEFINAILAIAN